MKNTAPGKTEKESTTTLPEKIYPVQKRSLFSRIHVSSKVLLLLLSIIFVATLIPAIYLINNNPIPNDPDGKIRVEIIKSLLDILCVAIVGGIIAAAFKAYERYHEESKLRVQAKIAFMEKLGELYRRVKLCRRKLNQNGIEATMEKTQVTLSKWQIELYHAQAIIMDDIQLELEGLKTASKNLFLYHYKKDVSFYLEKMEKYLREITKEFQDNFTSLKTLDTYELDKLPYLREFTFEKAENNQLPGEKEKNKIRGMDYCFKNNFSSCYYNVVINLT